MTVGNLKPFIKQRYQTNRISQPIITVMIKSPSEENIQYKCSVIQGGYEKLRQMSSNFKGISRKIKKLTKTLNQMSNYMDECQSLQNDAE